MVTFHTFPIQPCPHNDVRLQAKAQQQRAEKGCVIFTVAVTQGQERVRGMPSLQSGLPTTHHFCRVVGDQRNKARGMSWRFQ